MLPAGPPLAIQSKTTRVGNPKLPRYIASYACRHISRIIQESAQEPHGAELDGKAQTHVIPTFGRSQFAIGIVEVEMTCKLVRAGFTRIAAVSALLFCRQKGDRHRVISRRAARGRGALAAPHHRCRRTTC